jgi:Tol biopolymer transport system component
MIQARLIGLACVIACVVAAPSVAEAAFPGQNGRIAFSREHHDNWDIYTMAPGGGNEKRLTFELGFDTDPAWSPDGTKIAFTSSRDDGVGDIYVMNADGTDVEQVTSDPAADRSPDWSPDGRKLVFQTARETESDLYTVNVDGTDEGPLGGGVPGGDPAWSPDGRVAYECDGTYAAICTVNADGSGFRSLTGSEYGYEYSPDWSPDGKQIAYSSFPGVEDIWVMNADGTNQRNVTQWCCSYAPAWSPDGKQITFVDDECIGNDYYCSADGEIYTIGADGSGKRFITNNASGDWGPDWGVMAVTPLQHAVPTPPPVSVQRRCKLHRFLPDRACTPGVARKRVSRRTVCRRGSKAKSISASLAGQTLARYGLSPSNPDYVVDHLVSRTLGGSDSIQNLWPQRTAHARQKDRLERRLRRAVCSGKLGLRRAQRRLRADWRSAYVSEFRR